jgi:hypothetical protein
MHGAGMAMHGMRLLGTAPKAAPFDSTRGLTFVNSDLAFRGNIVYQGNFAGFVIWDVSNPAEPKMLSPRSRASPRRAIRPSSATCSSSPPKAVATATTAPRAACRTRPTTWRRAHL